MPNDNTRAIAKVEAQAAIDAASRDFAGGAITESTWQERVTNALAAAYLGEDDPRWQSGFDGDFELWREARELILDAVPANGSLLDVGCANGYLLECLDTWARDRGLDLSLYGLELNPELAETARRRLPAWSERIYTGNITTWLPPRRFTYVRTGLEYVPAGREPTLLARLFREVVEPGGRVIVGPISPEAVSSTLDWFRHVTAAKATVFSATDQNGKTRSVVWVGADRVPNGNRELAGS